MFQMVPGNSGQTQFQRVALPNAEVFEEEPLYVNAKQYRRILKRRQARAKLEAEGKIPKERPVSYIYIINNIIHIFYINFELISACRNIFMNLAIDTQ